MTYQQSTITHKIPYSREAWSEMLLGVSELDSAAEVGWLLAASGFCLAREEYAFNQSLYVTLRMLSDFGSLSAQLEDYIVDMCYDFDRQRIRYVLDVARTFTTYSPDITWFIPLKA